MDTNLSSNWTKHDNHIERHINKVSRMSARRPSDAQGNSKERKSILESEVMRSLFDMEMCIACKYQKFLYRDYVKKLMELD